MTQIGWPGNVVRWDPEKSKGRRDAADGWCLVELSVDDHEGKIVNKGEEWETLLVNGIYKGGVRILLWLEPLCCCMGTLSSSTKKQKQLIAKYKIEISFTKHITNYSNIYTI